jgi:prephenate dehydratase
MNIVCLGPAGTFSHEAAEKIFPGQEPQFAHNFDMLFDMLERDPSAIGVVPVENSLHGSVDEILDLLRESKAKIWQMHDVAIRHSFGALDPSKVTRVASHSQALRQSRKWLRENYPNAQHLSTSSTAAAVEMAMKKNDVGAIASANLIKKSGLQLVASDVEGTGNTTRFGIMSITDPFPGAKRTQMAISLRFLPDQEDRPGLLHAILTPFKVYDVNLSRIENRPTGRRLGDYNFFIDFYGSRDDARTQKVLDELRQKAEVQILGEW